jgi:hypothetical protein
MNILNVSINNVIAEKCKSIILPELGPIYDKIYKQNQYYLLFQSISK